MIHPTLTRILHGPPRTAVMGIVNVTPDSFSGDGLLKGTDLSGDFVERTVAAALAMVADGADILDIGAESTRPGAVPVSADDEIARIVPVIRGLKARTDVPISVDTYKAASAEAALDAGASMVNDVCALAADPEMGPLAARRGVPVVLMNNRRKAAQASPPDIVQDVRDGLAGRIKAARDFGIDPENIIVDPGIGFGTTPAQSLELIDRLNELTALGRPILVGPSRKSFIGFVLDAPPSERLEGTAATIACSILRGARIIRVHDVKPMVRVARMTDAIVYR